MSDTPEQGLEPRAEQRLPVPRPPAEVAPVERFTSPPSTRARRADAPSARPRSSASRRTPAGSASSASSSSILFVTIYWFYELAPLGHHASRGSTRRPQPSRSPRSSAATTCTRRTARAATARNGEGGHRPALNRQDKLFAHLTVDYLQQRAGRPAAATSAATRTRRCRSGRTGPSARSAELHPDRGPDRVHPRAEHRDLHRSATPSSIEPMSDPITGEVKTFTGWRRPELQAGAGRDAVPGLLVGRVRDRRPGRPRRPARRRASVVRPRAVGRRQRADGRRSRRPASIDADRR